MRRQIRRIVVCVVAGVLSTYLVSICCSIRYSMTNIGGYPFRLAPALCTWLWRPAEPWPQPDSKCQWHGAGIQIDEVGWAADNHEDADTSGLPLPMRTDLVHRPTVDRQELSQQRIFAGLPFWATVLESENAMWVSDVRVTMRGIRLWRTRVRDGRIEVDVPKWNDNLPAGGTRVAVIALLPYWPGFLADTAIYASLWWALLAGIPAARRALRRRRGLCTKCKYDLKDLATCPECGTPVPRSANATVPRPPVAITPASTAEGDA